MPTALFATAFAIEFGSDGDFATAVSLVTTIGSVITLTLLITFAIGNSLIISTY